MGGGGGYEAKSYDSKFYVESAENNLFFFIK